MRSVILLAIIAACLTIVYSAEDCPKFECPSFDGTYPDPCSCRRFIKCQDFVPHKPDNCPQGLFWDDEKQYCNFKDQVDCKDGKRVREIMRNFSPCYNEKLEGFYSTFCIQQVFQGSVSSQGSFQKLSWSTSFKDLNLGP